MKKDDSDADSGNEEPGVESDFYTPKPKRPTLRVKPIPHKQDKLAERISLLTVSTKQDHVPEGLVDSIPPEGTDFLFLLFLFLLHLFQNISLNDLQGKLINNLT